MFAPFEKTGDIAADAEPLATALQALADPDSIATLANAASLLNWYLDGINWVGFYLWNADDGELVLGPFQGLPACIRIKPGRGVCGTAYERGETQRIEDVAAFPGHIACDAASRSELVVPLAAEDGTLLGVLDIDSPEVGRFSAADADAMEAFCNVLGPLLSAAS